MPELHVLKHQYFLKMNGLDVSGSPLSTQELEEKYYTAMLGLDNTMPFWEKRLRWFQGNTLITGNAEPWYLEWMYYQGNVTPGPDYDALWELERDFYIQKLAA